MNDIQINERQGIVRTALTKLNRQDTNMNSPPNSKVTSTWKSAVCRLYQGGSMYYQHYHFNKRNIVNKMRDKCKTNFDLQSIIENKIQTRIW